jgi:hypothetical protein
MLALVIMGDLRVGIDQFRHLFEARFRHFQCAQGKNAAQLLDIEQWSESGDDTAVQQTSNPHDNVIGTAAQPGGQFIEGGGAQGKVTLHCIQQHSIEVAERLG